MIEEGLQGLSFKLIGLTPQAPTAAMAPSSSLNGDVIFRKEQAKSPHCTTCHHSTKGHCRPKNKKELTACKMCPENTCSPAGRNVNCSCQWHEEITKETIQGAHRGFHSNIYGNVVSGFLLPSKASQVGIAGDKGQIRHCDCNPHLHVCIQGMSLRRRCLLG